MQLNNHGAEVTVVLSRLSSWFASTLKATKLDNVLASYANFSVPQRILQSHIVSDVNAWNHTLAACLNLESWFQGVFHQQTHRRSAAGNGPMYFWNLVATCRGLDDAQFKKVKMCMFKFLRCTSRQLHFCGAQQTGQSLFLDVLVDEKPFWLQKLEIQVRIGLTI